jgi:hypothetical protein
MRFLLALPLLLSALPAAAQLPDRPITRAEVVAAARAQFARLDANRDGVVTADEVERFRATQPPKAQQSGIALLTRVGGRWFERADADGDGRVTRAEAEARPLQLFGMADADGNGVVTVREREMAEALMALTGR